MSLAVLIVLLCEICSTRCFPLFLCLFTFVQFIHSVYVCVCSTCKCKINYNVIEMRERERQRDTNAQWEMEGFIRTEKEDTMRQGKKTLLALGQHTRGEDCVCVLWSDEQRKRRKLLLEDDEDHHGREGRRCCRNEDKRRCVCPNTLHTRWTLSN